MLLLFFQPPSPTLIFPLSLHDALPIYPEPSHRFARAAVIAKSKSADLALVRFASRKLELRAIQLKPTGQTSRSEEHTSELQSPCNLVCRLLLEKKKENK